VNSEDRGIRTHQNGTEEVREARDEGEGQHGPPGRAPGPVDIDADGGETEPAAPVVPPVGVVPCRVAGIHARQLQAVRS
jgi:hypothetical protein